MAITSNEEELKKMKKKEEEVRSSRVMRVFLTSLAVLLVLVLLPIAAADRRAEEAMRGKENIIMATIKKFLGSDNEIEKLSLALLPPNITLAKVDSMPHESAALAGEVYTTGVASAVVSLRRAMHANPGIMYDEYFASETVVATLRAIGVREENIKTGYGITGVIAHIGAGTLDESLSMKSGMVPTIALRADMDALPIHEETDVPFKSTVDGVMHACGHDAHTAMLLGAAMLLKRHEAAIATMGGAVRLFFQPAEEGGAGAKAMIDQGALKGATAAAMLHVGSNMNTGTIIATRGQSHAACYTWHAVIKGVGAHGAAPHMSKDPIAAAGAIISAGNTIVSRTVKPTDVAVFSVGYVDAGVAFNVIPDEVTMGGTIRLTDVTLWDSFWDTIVTRITNIAEGYGCTAEVYNRDGDKGVNSRGEEFTIHAFPPNVNDDEMLDMGINLASRMYGAENTDILTARRTGCEDFAFLSQEVPGVQFRIGTKHPDHAPGEKTGTQGHNPLFDIDERALPRGSAFLASLALEYIKEKNLRDGHVEL